MARAVAPNLRPALVSDAPGIARVHVNSWLETYVGILPDTVLAGLSEEDRTGRWSAMLSQPSHEDGPRVVVAETEGEIVGFLAANAQRDAVLADAGFTGEIGSVYVLAKAQGRGIGRALMRAGAVDLSELGHSAASLWVLKDNLSARRFYESLGGQVVGEKADQRDGVLLQELAYGWSDLTEIIGDRRT